MQTLSGSTWDLFPLPGNESRPPALEAWSFSHWTTTREVPNASYYLFLERRWSSSALAYINISQTSDIGVIIIFFQICSLSTERLSNLPKVTQLVIGSVGIWTQAVCFCNVAFFGAPMAFQAHLLPAGGPLLHRPPNCKPLCEMWAPALQIGHITASDSVEKSPGHW